MVYSNGGGGGIINNYIIIIITITTTLQSDRVFRDSIILRISPLWPFLICISVERTWERLDNLSFLNMGGP